MRYVDFLGIEYVFDEYDSSPSKVQIEILALAEILSSHFIKFTVLHITKR